MVEQTNQVTREAPGNKQNIIREEKPITKTIHVQKSYILMRQSLTIVEVTLKRLEGMANKVFVSNEGDIFDTTGNCITYTSSKNAT